MKATDEAQILTGVGPPHSSLYIMGWGGKGLTSAHEEKSKGLVDQNEH